MSLQLLTILYLRLTRLEGYRRILCFAYRGSSEVKGNEKKKVSGRLQPVSVNAHTWFGCAPTGGGAHPCQCQRVETLRARQSARGLHQSRFPGDARDL